MANLKTMYKGVVNSPETYLKEVLTQGVTVMYVADGSVFGALPTLATIGDSESAETVLVKSKRSDGGYDIQRGFEGTDKKWDKATVVARNFTNYDYQTIIDNLNSLNNDKVEKSGSKVLSDNNYTNAAKAKVDAIPASPKYTDTTYDLTPYALKTDIKTSLSQMTQSSSYRTVSDAEKKSWNKLLENLSVVSSNPDSDGLYRTVEYRDKDGALVYKTELLGTAPNYSQLKLSVYEGGSVKSSQVWNLTYDGNDFVYKKEMM